MVITLTKKKKKDNTTQTIEPLLNQIEKNLLKIHYKIAELNNNINDLKKRLECMTGILYKILDKVDDIEGQYGVIIARLEETTIDKIIQKIKKIIKKS